MTAVELVHPVARATPRLNIAATQWVDCCEFWANLVNCEAILYLHMVGDDFGFYSEVLLLKLQITCAYFDTSIK